MNLTLFKGIVKLFMDKHWKMPGNLFCKVNDTSGLLLSKCKV